MHPRALSLWNIQIKTVNDDVDVKEPVRTIVSETTHRDINDFKKGYEPKT